MCLSARSPEFIETHSSGLCAMVRNVSTNSVLIPPVTEPSGLVSNRPGGLCFLVVTGFENLVL